MKQIAVAVFIFVFIGTGSVFGFQGSSEWIKYDSPAGRYSVLFPTPPTLSTHEAATPTGKKVTHYLATAFESKMGFIVGYWDYVPSNTFSLDMARDSMVQGIQGTLLSESAIRLGGSRGRELKVSAKGPDGTELLVRARFCDVHKRVYVVQFIIPKSADDSAAAEKAARYFDSFRVTKTP